MLFVSFQPYDWRTAVRLKDGWHIPQIYEEELGFNPMYCISAEQLDVALINACLIEPCTPEVAVFFKTNEFWMVERIEHYKWLKTKGRAPFIFSREGLKARGLLGSVADFLTEYKPFDFEYLVNRDTIKVIKEIDIKAMVETEFGDKKALQDGLEAWLKVSRESYRPEIWAPNGVTKERYFRNEEAWYYFSTYIRNDFFVRDYKRIVGMKNQEEEVIADNAGDMRINDLKNEFDEHPSQENLDAYIEYMESIIYK
jgi:hypothetical protein